MLLPHLSLVREAKRELDASGIDDTSRRRRKRARRGDTVTPEPLPQRAPTPISISSDDSHDGGDGGDGGENESDDDFEDLFPTETTSEPKLTLTTIIKHTEASDDDSDFEDVDLGGVPQAQDMTQGGVNPSTTTNNTLVIPIHKPEEPVKKVARVIPKEERATRRWCHMAFIVAMIGHCLIRNKWANSVDIQEKLAKSVSLQTRALLHPSTTGNNLLPVVKLRKFLDGLKRTMLVFSKKWKVVYQGLIFKTWGELGMSQRGVYHGRMTRAKWQQMILEFQGTRDMGAQAFCAMLRGLGVRARLVHSVQAPDYTSIVPNVEPPNKEKTDDSRPKPMGSSKQQFLQQVRSFNPSDKDSPANKFIDSSYPIWWVEAWDKYAKKWVAIDPVVLKHLEVPPQRRKSKFEPPGSDQRNQLHYVLAFDARNRVKDVTRRYSLQFNAKTQKKRIGQYSEESHWWYANLMRKLSGDKVTQLDVLELKEFHDRDLAEGMPNNMGDFKNHPLYALESQLHYNQVVEPKIKVGTFRPKTLKKGQNSAPLIPVYRRANVKTLKLAKAWWMLGRQLKVGVQPLKVRPAKLDEEEDERLYAEDQTQLFIPEPIKDGVIVRNAFGTVDCYVPLMVPENGWLISLEDFPIKLAEQAARIIGIDYARAVVGFSFKGRRNVKATEGGVLVALEYREAMEAVMDCLLEEEVEKIRRDKELAGLKLWRFFIAKLRVGERLNRVHGEVEDDVVSEVEDEEAELDFSVGSEDEGGSGDEVVPQQESREARMRSRRQRLESVAPLNSSDDEDDYGGGFIPENGGGFIISDTDNGGGGFIVSDNDEGGFIVSDKEDPVNNHDDSGGGGFFVAENDEIQTYEGSGGGFSREASLQAQTPQETMANTQADVDLDIPDDMFDYNEDGELVYNPDGAVNSPDTPSPQSSPSAPNSPAQAPVMSQGELHQLEQEEQEYDFDYDSE